MIQLYSTHVSSRERYFPPRAPISDELSGRPELISGWGRSPTVQANVVQLRNQDQLALLLKQPPQRGLIARGAGHSLGDAAQRAGGLVLHMTGLNRLLAFDSREGIATVEAGMGLGALMREIVPYGWLPAVLPATRFVTVGGAIAADVHGRNQHLDGSFSDHVLRFTLCTPAGSFTVDRDSASDLFWATVGGMGLTGVIVDATLKLAPIETASLRVRTERAPNLDEVLERMSDERDPYRFSAAWIDCLSTGKSLGRGVVVRGNYATHNDLTEFNACDSGQFSPAQQVRFPRPASYAAHMLVRTMNEVVFRRAPARRDDCQSLQQFFYTHDRLDLFHLFAPDGIVEYQFVVPFEQAAVVQRVIELITSSDVQPFFSVVKRFGRQNSGPLSFPMSGWMAAFDFAFSSDLLRLFRNLDHLIADAGGRIYLAKDASVCPELLPVMYPKIPAWREDRAKIDPDGTMRSDLSERLGLL